MPRTHFVRDGGGNKWMDSFYHPYWRPNTGNIFFVDSNGSGGTSSSYGWSAENVFSGISVAVDQCAANNGDIIYVMEGHSETLTSAIAVDVAGVTIIGLGHGTSRPQITVNGAIDGISVSAADCVIENLYFNEATAAATANINIAAARCTVRNCHFDLGANDLDNITITADGDEATIENCTFRITANGPDSAITVEGAADYLSIKNNFFDGGSTTNVWDDAALDFGSTTAVNHLITGNVFTYGVAMVSTGANPKICGNNQFLRSARPISGATVDIYASAGVTGTKSGSAQDPTTLTDAVDLALAGDRVLLYNGTYTVTAAFAMDVANLTLQAVDYRPGCRGSGVEIANDTDDVNTIDVTAAGCAIRGIRFTKGAANTTDGTELIDINSGGDYLTIVDCVFDLETRANADGINIATGTKGLLVQNCLFTDGAVGKSYIAWACSTLEVKECTFDSSAAIVVCLEQIASPGDGAFIHDNLFVSSGSAGGGAGSTVSWQSSPGKNVFTRNYLFGTAGDVDSCGDDGDLDAYVYGNFRDGATDGTTTALNPSVS